MAHFNLDKQISEATKLDAPIQRGPMMRWQRKTLEGRVNALSLDNNMSTSGFQGQKSGHSFVKTPLSGKCSPGRLASLSDSLVSGKTPNKCKTPGKNKTPNKSGHNTPHHGQDRFIPNRSAMDMESGHFMLTNSENVDPVNPDQSPGTAEHQRQVAAALKGLRPPEAKKILAFKQKAPNAPEDHISNLKILYSGAHSSASQKVNSLRHIPQAPERILDAPELLDDFYLNLLSWSSTNQLAVALGQLVYLWNAATGSITQLLELEHPDEYISSLSWIKEGNILAVGNSDGCVQLWDVTTQKKMRSMTGHAARVGCLSWQSYILSSGSRSGAIHHHDVRVADHHVGTNNSHTQEVCGLAWSPDGRHLASGANDNLLHVWDASIGHETQPIQTFTQHQAAVKAMAWCPWQPNLLASGGGTADRYIRFWNVTTGSCLQGVDTHSQVSSLVWSREHRELISGHGFSQYQLTLWKYPSMTKVADLHGHQARILCMAVSPDGSVVASAAADETLRLWKCWATDKSKTKASAAKSGGLKHAGSGLLSKGLR